MEDAERSKNRRTHTWKNDGPGMSCTSCGVKGWEQLANEPCPYAEPDLS